MNQTLLNLKILILLILTLNTFSFGFAHTGSHSNQGKFWHIQDASLTIQGNYIALKDQDVFLKDQNTNIILSFPLTDFSMEDQLLILKHYELSKKINAQNENLVHIDTELVKGYSKKKAKKLIVLLFFLTVSIIIFFGISKVRKPALISFICFSFVLILITCSNEEDEVPEQITSTPPTTASEPPTPNSNASSTASSSTDTTTSQNVSPTSDSTAPEGTILSTIINHFEAYSGVTITSDDNFFYINSYSWPEHGMGVGITSWQEQVPIPQNYTGDNSWVIPLNPEMADEPLSTNDHLLKGALAVAVNGVPIFNVFNNRGENAYLIGELDNWGGHFGRGDDYHYHLIPTHLEETVGTDQPLAYALDGYPVYGYTTETLDDAFGRYDSNDNYQYHAKNVEPYYMPFVMGKVTIDPNSTAPEDQIYPQPVQNPIRASNDFKPVNGASVTDFSQTGNNAFSFEYTVSGIKYYVNYNWDEDCKFTYTYIDENGGTSNLPTYGAITDTSQNVEVYSKVSFCQDVNLAGSVNNQNDNSSSSSNSSNETDTSVTPDSSLTGYSVTSDNSDFTLTSSAINSEGEILDAFKCEEKINGVEKSIPIAWSNIPDGTGSIAISIHGSPNPNETNSYLTLWNIDPSVTEITYGEANNGLWYMGPNKDGASISYSSPCSPSAGSNTYYMTIYALSETPSSLPESNSLTVNYSVLLESLSEVTIVDQVILQYVSVTN